MDGSLESTHLTTILVVEDSPTQREQLRYLLEDSGFSVIAARDGREGLAALRANAVDLVITDIVMPEMDGYALCRALRAEPALQDLPVILLTSLGDPQDVIRGLESGANNFICKPYEASTLLVRVRNILANQEIRKVSTSEMGINIFFAGQRFFITADRLQILDLLLSTYENAVCRNTELVRTRDELRLLNEQLEARVAERTAALQAEIKERLRAEEERRQLTAQMVQSQRLESIGTLASGVAHEINNPLNVIMNFGQLILDDEATPEERREYAGAIVRESERMAAIVRNLLAFSRNEKEAHSPADVATIVDTTLSLIRSSFRKDRIEVITEIPSGLPKIRCRSQQIQQVLLNLLTNARDALNARFPGASPDKIIRVAVHPYEEEGSRWTRLTVEDQGAGIPPEVAERVFDPFFTTKPKDKGTGLGLSISYGIVKDHGGAIWFESQPDAGTRFHVDLKVDNGWSLEKPASPCGALPSRPLS